MVLFFVNWSFISSFFRKKKQAITFGKKTFYKGKFDEFLFTALTFDKDVGSFQIFCMDLRF